MVGTLRKTPVWPLIFQESVPVQQKMHAAAEAEESYALNYFFLSFS